MSCDVPLRDLIHKAMMRADTARISEDAAFGYDDAESNDQTRQPDVNFGLSPLSSLESSPVSSQLILPGDLPSACPTDLSSVADSATNPDLSAASEPKANLSNKRKRKIAYQKKRSRAKRNQEQPRTKTEADDFNFEPYEGAEDKFIVTDDVIQVDYDSTKLKTAASGFVGAKAEGLQRPLPLDDVVGPDSKYKFRLVKWTGRSRGVVDKDRQLFVVIVAPPADKKSQPTWSANSEHCASVLEDLRKDLYLTREEKIHRRGKFPAMPFGISLGQGQPKPMNLKQHETNHPILDSIRQDEAFIRVAGHQSAAFRLWAPELYSYYSTTMKALLTQDKELEMNFPNSVFACTSVNFGPRTICFRHNDMANLPYGWCAITPFGKFSYTEGGHIILWECGLVIELPPGATILIPSASISHSNVAIKNTEHRYSMTQYTSGSLFRWVERGFQKDETYKKGMTDEELEIVLEEDRQRLEYGLSLYRNL